MSDRNGITTVLLVPTNSIAKTLSVELAQRSCVREGHVAIVLTTAASCVASADARKRYGSAAIGIVAHTEAETFAALQAGADEGMVWPPTEQLTVVGFLDRTQLRGSVRSHHQRLSASAAHNDKLVALGTLVASVAHEINNPLTSLELSVQAFRQRALLSSHPQKRQIETNVDPESERLLDEMVAATTVIGQVVRDLKLFASGGPIEEEGELLQPNGVAEYALRLVRRELESSGALVKNLGSGLPSIVAPQGRLIQVLVNILLNATDAVREVANRTIRLSTQVEHNYVKFSVNDTGHGISTDSLSKIFDPFYTTKHAQLGTGLGLSISRDIMRSLGGDLIVESTSGHGATFSMLIPIPDAATLRESIAPSAPRESGIRYTTQFGVPKRKRTATDG